MTHGVWAVLGVASAIVGLLTAGLGVMRWVIRHEVRDLRAEMKPNGGNSFRDHVDRRFDHLDDRLEGLDERLATTEDKVWGRKRVR